MLGPGVLQLNARGRLAAGRSDFYLCIRRDTEDRESARSLVDDITRQIEENGSRHEPADQ
jgi:hypothetical protein